MPLTNKDKALLRKVGAECGLKIRFQGENVLLTNEGEAISLPQQDFARLLQAARKNKQ